MSSSWFSIGNWLSKPSDWSPRTVGGTLIIVLLLSLALTLFSLPKFAGRFGFWIVAVGVFTLASSLYHIWLNYQWDEPSVNPLLEVRSIIDPDHGFMVRLSIGLKSRNIPSYTVKDIQVTFYAKEDTRDPVQHSLADIEDREFTTIEGQRLVGYTLANAEGAVPTQTITFSIEPERPLEVELKFQFDDEELQDVSTGRKNIPIPDNYLSESG